MSSNFTNEDVNLIMECSSLSRTETKRLLDLCEPVEFSSKTLINKVGDKVNHCYFLKEGIIRHYIEDNKKDVTLNFLKGPNLMLTSITSFFMETPSEINCATITPISGFKIEKEKFLSFCSEHPSCFKTILNGVVHAFNKKEKKENHHTRKSAKERYSRFLLDYEELAHEVPLRHIASYLDIRPETLSRIRSDK